MAVPRSSALGGAGNGTSVRPRGGRTPAVGGMSRSAHMHGHSGLNPMFPRPPMLDGAGNGTSAYLLCKYAPASGACRRLRLLATNASRLLYARTLAGSGPGTLSKKARHRNGAVLVLLLERATGLEPASVSLGILHASVQRDKKCCYRCR